MSLINQMLKDLDKRRGPINESQAAALEGMGLVNNNRFSWYDTLGISAVAIATLLAILVSYHGVPWWKSRSNPEIGTAIPAINEIHLPIPEVKPEAAADQHGAEPEPRAAAHTSETGETLLDTPLAGQAPELPAAVQVSEAPVVRSSSALTPEEKAERFFTRAQQAFSGGQQQTGEQLLRRALDEDNRHIAARSQLVTLLLNRRQEVQAEQLLAQGLLSDSSQLVLARPYARLLAERGELLTALETLDSAITQHPPDAETLALRAAILYRSGRLAESAADYRRALQIESNQGLWWTGLAVALEQDDRPGQALVAFRRAAELPLNRPVDEYVAQRIHALSGDDSNE